MTISCDHHGGLKKIIINYCTKKLLESPWRKDGVFDAKPQSYPEFCYTISVMFLGWCQTQNVETAVNKILNTFQ